MIILFNDLGEEIKGSTQIVRLIKTNRHIKTMVIISLLYLNNLRPEAIANLDYFFYWDLSKHEKDHSKKS